MTLAIRPASPKVRDALRAALVDSGCPASSAATVTDQATLQQDEDGDYICVLGNCVGVVGDDDTSALEALAEDVVADNAEAHDRTARGKAGCEPLWPLTDRARPPMGVVPIPSTTLGPC